MGLRSVLVTVLILSCCTAQPKPAPGGATATSPPSAPTASASRAPPVPSASVTPQPTSLPPELEPGGEHAVEGDHGVVTSVEENATRAGVRILEEGGNAVDAAVAVAYALAVTHPSAGNIGGGGFMLVGMRGKPVRAIDFRERAPATTNDEAFAAMIRRKARGPEASAVPGSVAGLNLAHSDFGRLPLARVIAPAIQLARDGHRIGKRQGKVLGWAWPVLRADSSARRIFGRAGAPARAGDLLRQPDLAKTLERIASSGNDGFYAGETADRIVAAMGRRGRISAQDLRDYRAVYREPLTFPYRGYTVVVMPPPSAGGVAVARMLRSLETMKAHEAAPQSADALHTFIEVARRAHAERRFHVVDPDSVDGYDGAARRARWLDPRALLDAEPHIDPNRATPSSRIHPLYEAARKELPHTTHFSVADADGNVVSCTTTLSAGFGARYVAAGTGVVMNNSLAAFGTVGDDVPKPRRRMTSSMSPTLVLRGSEPVLILGSPGGDTIANTVVQVLRNAVDYRMTIDAAVDAPRVHHGFVPDEVRTEGARPISSEVMRELVRRGHVISRQKTNIGDANDVLIAEGKAWAFADRREGGLALAANRPSATPPPASSAAPSSSAAPK